VNPSPQAKPGTPKPMQPQIVQDIPVKAQAPAARLSSDVVAKAASQAGSTRLADKELDQILKDVSHEVKNPKTSNTGTQSITKKAGAKSHGLQLPLARVKSALPALAAVVIAAALSAAAVYAFKQTQKPASSASSAGKVGTSSTSSDAIQAAGGTLITPSDLDNFSSSVQSQTNGLNDAQDFNAKDLADQNLGL
jgi:hypothetical protein